MYKIYIFMKKKLIRILARALHEYVNFVHDPEKQYRSLSEWSATGVYVLHVPGTVVFTHVGRNTGKSLQVTCKLLSYGNWLRIHRRICTRTCMDLNKFIPTENQLHPVHLVCAEGLYVPSSLKRLGVWTKARNVM